jgi:hypothetical protein
MTRSYCLPLAEHAGGDFAEENVFPSDAHEAQT